MKVRLNAMAVVGVALPLVDFPKSNVDGSVTIWEQEVRDK